MGRTRFRVVGLCALLGLLACGQPEGEEIVTTTGALVRTSASGVHGYTRSDGMHAMVYRGANGEIYETLENPYGVGPTHNLRTASGRCPVWGYKRTDNIDVVVYLDGDGHVHELALVNGSWLDTDFTTHPQILAPAGPSGADQANGCEIIPYVRTDGVNALVYRGPQRQILEIDSNFPSFPPWIPRSLSNISHSMLVKVGTAPAPYRRLDDRNAVVYTAIDSHVHELSAAPGTNDWGDTDLFVASGETIPAAGSPWGFVRGAPLLPNPSNVVVYVGNESPVAKIHQLSKTGTTCGLKTGWCTQIISQTFTRVQASDRLSGYVRRDGRVAVLYTGTDNLIRELLAGSGGTWTETLFPNQFGFGEVSSTPFGHVAPGNRSSVLMIQKFNDFDIEAFEYSLVNGGSTWEFQIVSN